MTTPDSNPIDPNTALFRRLRAIKAACGLKPNKDDLAIVLITACIQEGLNQGRRITGALERLGLNRRHAGKILAEGTGDCPSRHRWQRDSDGFYSLHEDDVSG